MPYLEGDFRAWCEALETEFEAEGPSAFTAAVEELESDLREHHLRNTRVDVSALLAEIEAFPRLRAQAIQEAFRPLWTTAMTTHPEPTASLPPWYIVEDWDAWEDECENL